MNLRWPKKPKPDHRRVDEDSGEKAGYEDTRVGRGRRASDRERSTTRLEVHPLLLIALTTLIGIVVGVVGYQWKSSQDGITYEIHQLRTDLSQVLKDNASADEWKRDMSRWRDQTDQKLDGLDQRIDTLQVRQNARPFPWQRSQEHTGQN